MKKIIIPILIIFLTFAIYKANDDNLIDYMSIGDSMTLGINSYGNTSFGYNNYIKNYLDNNNLLHQYNNYFSMQDYTISELNKDIINNKTVLYSDKNYSIKKELREADIITLSIGMDYLVSTINYGGDIENLDQMYPIIDEMTKEMNELIKNIKRYSSAEIILIGYYNPYNNYTKNLNKLFAYINDKYSTISKNNNIKYIDIYEKISNNKNYLPNNKDYHLTTKGYLEIANNVISYLDNKLKKS